jgi:hypothetical protein
MPCHAERNINSFNDRMTDSIVKTATLAAHVSDHGVSTTIEVSCLRDKTVGGLYIDDRNQCVVHAAATGGSKVLRFVFLDEGGISRYEPFVVVAGVIVHGDEQLIPLERELANLVKKHIPKEHQPGFVFHATDIWSGTGKIFGDRDRWTLDRRLIILRDLARIPRKLDIPIVHESYEKAKFLEDRPKSSIPTAHEISVAAHAVAFASCTLRIEEYMRECFSSEVAQIVAEDNDQARKMIKNVHDGFRYPQRLEGIIRNTLLPLRHIRGSVHFADKNESAPLQIADLCAFIIRGYLSKKHPLNARLYRRIRPMMMRYADHEGNYCGPTITTWPPYVPMVIEQSDEKIAQTYPAPGTEASQTS